MSKENKKASLKPVTKKSKKENVSEQDNQKHKEMDEKSERK